MGRKVSSPFDLAKRRMAVATDLDFASITRVTLEHYAELGSQKRSNRQLKDQPEGISGKATRGRGFQPRSPSLKNIRKRAKKHTLLRAPEPP